MKYQVQIKYTNPGHEHISLRRRVDTITRVVEAANEAEALNRAANQQRSLGFLIQEAAVMNPSKEENLHADEKEKKKKKVVGDDSEETDIAAAGGVKEANGTAAYPLLKKGEKLKPMKLKEEEVELDEAQKKLKPSYWKAEWRLGTQSEVDKNNKKIFDRLAKTDPVKAAAFHDNLMRMKKKDVDAVHKSMEKEMQREAVDPDKRDAGYKMSPAVRKAQAASDALSKREKKPQAGTLAAQKSRKAAEKMVNKAKGKANKINMTPELTPGEPND